MRNRKAKHVGALALLSSAILLLIGLAARRAGWADPPVGWPGALADLSFAVAAVIEPEP